MPIDTQSDPQIETPEPRQMSRTIVLILMWLVLLNLFFSQMSEHQPVPYSDFINQVEAGKVARVAIAPNRIQYVLKSDRAANQSETSSSKRYPPTLVMTFKKQQTSPSASLPSMV
jgi:cell division protease FtsH